MASWFCSQACPAYIATMSLSAGDIPSPRPGKVLASHGGADVIIVSDDTLLALVSLTGMVEAGTLHKINVQRVTGTYPGGTDVIIVSDGNAFKLRNTP